MTADSHDLPADRIEWWDELATNSRWYRHIGCDGGTSRYVFPLDDTPPPSLPDAECAHCCYMRPLVPRAAHRNLRGETVADGDAWTP